MSKCSFNIHYSDVPYLNGSRYYVTVWLPKYGMGIARMSTKPTKRKLRSMRKSVKLHALKQALEGTETNE